MTAITTTIAGLPVHFVCGRGLAALYAGAIASGEIGPDGQHQSPLVFAAAVLGVCGEAHQPDVDWNGLVADAAELAAGGDDAALAELLHAAAECGEALFPPEPVPDELPGPLGPPVGSDAWHAAYGGRRWFPGCGWSPEDAR